MEISYAPRIQSGEIPHVILVDSSGNPISSHESGDGDWHLATEGPIAGRENTTRHVWVTTTNALTVAENKRLVGTNKDK